MNQIAQDNYLVNPEDIHNSILKVGGTGQVLDLNAEENIQGLQVLAIGERSGRLLAEIGYPDGNVVLFYRSKSGTSGKNQGEWYPIGGFMSKSLWIYPEGWFIKDKGVLERYGSKVYAATADYIGANEEKIF